MKKLFDLATGMRTAAIIVVVVVIAAACADRAAPAYEPAHVVQPVPRPASVEVGLELERSGDHTGAFAVFHAACETEVRGCIAAWMLIARGQVPGSSDTELMYLMKACGDPDGVVYLPLACAFAGRLLLDGKAAYTGVPDDDAAHGLALLARACRAREAMACRDAGLAYRDRGDDEAANRYFIIGCRNAPEKFDNSLACREAGTMILAWRGRRRSSFAHGAELLARSCEGFPLGC